MNLAAKQPLELPIDGRQSETALAVARGTARLLHAHGSLPSFPGPESPALEMWTHPAIDLSLEISQKWLRARGATIEEYVFAEPNPTCPTKISWC